MTAGRRTDPWLEERGRAQPQQRRRHATPGHEQQRGHEDDSGCEHRHTQMQESMALVGAGTVAGSVAVRSRRVSARAVADRGGRPVADSRIGDSGDVMHRDDAGHDGNQDRQTHHEPADPHEGRE